jgi:hypothetical protein
MNWYKESQQVAPLGADDQGKLTLRVNGEVREYQLPYTAVGSYSDIANLIQRKQIKKLNQYIQWLEQFRQGQKVAQTYEDIVQYPDEYGEDVESNRYFSIGQNEETINDSFCWIWINNQLHTALGPTSHNMSFGLGKLTNNIHSHYRGWYDPIQELLSVVAPNFSGERGLTENDIPSVLRRSLFRKFGEDAQLVVF